MGDCCELMKLALTRTAGKRTRLPGLSMETAVNFGTGKRRTRLVYNLPKASRDDQTEFAKASYSWVEFCPFCGKKAESPSD